MKVVVLVALMSLVLTANASGPWNCDWLNKCPITMTCWMNSFGDILCRPIGQPPPLSLCYDGSCDDSLAENVADHPKLLAKLEAKQPIIEAVVPESKH